MAKELYIYSPLYSFTAERVVEQLNSVSEDEDLTIRMNTPGGEVMAGWSIISKLSERKSKVKAVIDGDAMSMGAMMLVFFDEVVANDTSDIMFHKAAYPSWHTPDASELEKVKTINSQFKEKLSAKVNGKDGAREFLAKVFEADVRNDVSLTPTEAKKLGIITEIKKLTPKAEFKGSQIVAMFEAPKEVIAKKETPSGEQINNNQNLKSMDLAKLKAEHPAVYQAAFAEGETKGQASERDRVEAWAAYNEVNPERVKAGIESGEPLSMKVMAEMNLQVAKAQKVEAAKIDNPDDTDTGSEGKTEEQIKAEAQKAEMDKLFGGDK